MMLRLALVTAAMLCLLAPLSHAEEVGSADPWVLEFGPFVGYYDFDDLTAYEDFGLFGARLGVRLESWLRLETGFEEVYTEREITGNRARQISMTVHGRVQPFELRLSPYVLAGGAVVFFDDSEDPDAWGAALDLGLGAAWALRPRWEVRIEWMLRRQGMQLLRQVAVEDGFALEEEPVTLWGRALRIGVSRVF